MKLCLQKYFLAVILKNIQPNIRFSRTFHSGFTPSPFVENYIFFPVNILKNGFKLLTFLQKRGFKCVLYPDDHKLKKQLKFANQSQIPQVIFLKDPFSEDVTVELKNMINGEQRNINISDLKN